MTLVATCQGKEYQIRIQGTTAEGDFSIRISGPGGERVIPVRRLARRGGHWMLEVDGRIEEAVITDREDHLLVDWKNRLFGIQITSLHRKLARASTASGVMAGAGRVRAQMPGTVIRVLVHQGQKVEAGQGLVIVEAMKMQNQIASPRAGRISHCGVEDGQAVNTGDLLFDIEEAG